MDVNNENCDLESLYSLRKKLNVVENEKLDAISAANEEVNRLSAEVAHLHSQLEKGEVVKLNLEYELVKVNKELAAECRLRLEHEATSAETLQTLQRNVEELNSHIAELTSDAEASRQALTQLRTTIDEKEKSLTERNHLVAMSEEIKQQSQLDLQQKERAIEALESELRRLKGLHDQFLEEAQQHEQEEVAMRDQLVNTAKELTQLSNHIAALEQAIEAERTSHIQTKFRCELFQLRVRDLENALQSEKTAKSEAFTNVEKLSDRLRELQESCETERRRTLHMKSRLVRSERDREASNEKLTAELDDKRTSAAKLSDQTELDQLKSELTRLRKKQAVLDEGYISAVTELRLIMSYSDKDSDKIPASQTKQTASVKALSGAVRDIRQLIVDYRKSNNSLSTNLLSQKRQMEKLGSDLKLCRDKLSARDKLVQESNEALSKAKMAAEQSASDCQHLTVECRQLRERLTEQQCRSQKLCDQMLRVSQKCKTDEQTSATFLALLHQQLNTASTSTSASDHPAVPASVTVTDVSMEPETWNDLALLVNEQVSILISQHKRSIEKVLDLERMVKERDEMIDELKATNAEQRNRLAHSSDEETHQLQQQRSSLEQHYKCIIDEMNSRNEQLQGEVELAWSRAEAIRTVQQGLDSAFAQLQSQIEVDHHSVDCILAAVALLCGTIYPLSVRASQLVTQTHILAAQLQQFDTFKRQVAELISALTFIRESDSDVVVPDSQSVHKPRFRLTVIAVIAANRLIRWSASGCRLSAVCSSLRAGPISNILCVGDVQTDINSHFNGKSRCKTRNQLLTSDNISRWFSSSQLQRVILAAVSDLKSAMEATDVDAAHISAVACSTAEKLMSEFPKFFPSISSLSSDKTYCSPLAADLSRGLFCMLDDRRYNSFPTKLYPSSSDLVAGLRQCLLEFTRRLHQAEVDRHGLNTRLSRLLPRHSGVVEILDDEDRSQSDLSQHQAEVSVTALRRRGMKQLRNRVSMLVQEKQMLENNICDAEAALRTAARDKKILLEYVASVEKALEASDSGAIEWPSDELLPADLGVVVNSKRKSSSLVAVQSLVMLFVLMHNRLVSRLTSARDHSCQLQQEVERLQLELCQRITPAEVDKARKSAVATEVDTTAMKL